MKKRGADFSEKQVKTVAPQDKKLSTSLDETCTDIRALMNNSADLIIKFAETAGVKMAVVTCEGMIDKSNLANLIYRPLISNPPQGCKDARELFDSIAGKMFIA